MPELEDQIVRELEKVEEDIDTVDFADPEAWKYIINQMEGIVHSVSPDMTHLLQLFNRSLEVIQRISNKNTTDTLALIEALSKGINASRKYRLDDPESEQRVLNAVQELDALMIRDLDELDKENDSVEKNTKRDLGLTLNDAAAFLIQLEPNDLSKLAQLKEMLDSIADRVSCSELSREHIRKAVQTIEGIIFKYISDTDSAINKIGQYIDSAMSVQEKAEDMVEDAGEDPIAEEGSRPVDPDFFEMPESAFAELIDEFIIEGFELIASAEEALLSLENNLEDMDALDTVFRAFHSIKGSAALLKFDIINELAHQAEDLLDRMRCEEIRCTGEYADLAFKSLDMLREFFSIIKNAPTGEKIIKPVGYNALKSELSITVENVVNESESKHTLNSSTSHVDTKQEGGIEEIGLEDLPDYMPKDVDFELIAELLTEGGELVSQAEEALLVLESDPDDMSAVDMVFRAFHTIKGTSGFLDLSLLADLGHHAETLLRRVRDGDIRYLGGYADLALHALDMIKDIIRNVESSLNGEALLKPEGYNDLMKILEHPEKAGVSEKTAESCTTQPDPAPCKQQNKQNGESETSPSPRLGGIIVAQGKMQRKTLEHIAANKGDGPIGEAILESGAISVTDVGHAIRAQSCGKEPKQKTVQASVRVATDRLDRLIDMVGELVIAHSMVIGDQIVAGSKDHEFQKKVSQASKIVRELQNMTLSLRMVPLKTTFNKMNRLVRDISRKIGKKVNCIIEGEDTDIDRNMADAIKDPLVHMVRNAVDHGIEKHDERERLGKPTEGTIKLSAYHSAGSVVVEIEDDGKGLDREKILAKSIERGLLKEEASLSEREILNMIFEPGFSTAKTITNVSGRGVGMDVVRKNIEAIRGQTEIQTELGKGSLFQMRFPLTLAIIDGMAIRVGPETFVIPTLSIVTSINPEPGSISKILDQGEMLSLQGKLIPLFRMADLFQIQGQEEKREIKLVVVVEDDGKQVGLVIDELIGRQQVVIKTLGKTMRNIMGIAGGAIMPNGRVGLILDVGGVVKLTNTYSRENFKAVA